VVGGVSPAVPVTAHTLFYVPEVIKDGTIGTGDSRTYLMESPFLPPASCASFIWPLV
jgi:hypothetical protein